MELLVAGPEPYVTSNWSLCCERSTEGLGRPLTKRNLRVQERFTIQHGLGVLFINGLYMHLFVSCVFSSVWRPGSIH